MSKLTLKSLESRFNSAVSTMSNFMSYRNFLGQQFGGKRDVYDVLGYKKQPIFDDFYGKFDREGIARRIVSAPVDEAWKHSPEIIEEGEPENSEFEKGWLELCKRLRVYNYLARTDKLAGIGRYAVLLIGVAGEPKLEVPLTKSTAFNPEKIIYLRAFHEGQAEINTLITNEESPDYGKPETYKIDFTNDKDGGRSGQRVVHHSRVIHFADGLIDDEVYGTPRLRPVLNYLDDILKVGGGAGEMFWLTANKGLHMDVNPDFMAFQSEEEKDLEKRADEYQHGLRRILKTRGVDVKTLGTDIASPKDAMEVIISLISGTTNIPKRILVGSERGELSSSQDEGNWKGFIVSRQTSVLEPDLLMKFVQKMDTLGVLQMPEAGVKVVWPNLFTKTQKEVADAANLTASALQKYTANTVIQQVVPVSEYREKFLELPPEIPETEVELEQPEVKTPKKKEPKEDEQEKDTTSN